MASAIIKNMTAAWYPDTDGRNVWMVVFMLIINKLGIVDQRILPYSVAGVSGIRYCLHIRINLIQRN